MPTVRMIRGIVISLGFASSAVLAQDGNWTNVSPITFRDFGIRRFTTSSLTDADAERILRDASAVLQQNDGPGDVACPVGFRRTGSVTVFTEGDGSIDSAAEFNTIINLPGEIMVVNAINWCDRLKPNIFGCAPEPGNSMAVVRFTSALEGILWAHELGHNRRLRHRNGANELMAEWIYSTHRRVNDAECTAFRTAPATAMAAIGTPSPGAGALDGAGNSAEPQASQDIRSFVRQVFIHGVPYEEASRFGREAVPVLIEMLRDPQEQAYWANIAVTLGMIGDPSAVEPMIAFIQSAGNEQDRARTSAVMSLGYIVNKSGDTQALNYLIEGASPAVWRERTVQGLAPSQADAAARANELSKYAIFGLALSGRPEAGDALRQMQGNTGLWRLAPEADHLIDSALIENEKIQREGLANYYRDPHH